MSKNQLEIYIYIYLYIIFMKSKSNKINSLRIIDSLDIE